MKIKSELNQCINSIQQVCSAWSIVSTDLNTELPSIACENTSGEGVDDIGGHDRTKSATYEAVERLV